MGSVGTIFMTPETCYVTKTLVVVEVIFKCDFTRFLIHKLTVAQLLNTFPVIF
jgi:hypothetical protein